MHEPDRHGAEEGSDQRASHGFLDEGRHHRGELGVGCILQEVVSDDDVDDLECREERRQRDDQCPVTGQGATHERDENHSATPSGPE